MVTQAGPGILEGLCAGPMAAPGDGLAPGAPLAAGDRLVLGAAAPGLERSAARFAGRAYAPHRHDTYGIGITTHGVQSFRYRGVVRHSLPGQLHVLHPDELHDGNPGTEDGFGYRILHMDPALVRQALPRGPLPFVADGVVAGAALPQPLHAALAGLDGALDEAAQVELVVAVADLLRALADGPATAPVLDLARLGRVRAAIADDPAAPLAMARLEAVAGMDRWRLARQFRWAFGVSPRAFRGLRQLEGVRALLRAGEGPAQAAAAMGFADQAHMTRLFRRAYGMPPGRWVRMMGTVQDSGWPVPARAAMGRRQPR